MLTRGAQLGILEINGRLFSLSGMFEGAEISDACWVCQLGHSPAQTYPSPQERDCVLTAVMSATPQPRGSPLHKHWASCTQATHGIGNICLIRVKEICNKRT